MALVGVERKTLVSEPDEPTTRPPPCVKLQQTPCSPVSNITTASLQLLHYRLYSLFAIARSSFNTSGT